MTGNTSTRKAESNRLNSRHSTGPKTAKGKAAVSQNAARHGAYSEALTMLLESPEEFEKVRAGMVESLQPLGPLEVDLVERMASLWWRMNRTKAAANQTLWMGARSRLKGTLGAFMVDMDPFEEGAAVDRDECRYPGAWDVDRQERLLRHEMTLERAFYRTLHELERLQARRQGQLTPPPVVVDVNFTGLQD